MTKVHIDPGVCGLPTAVEATSDDGMEVRLKIASGCEPLRRLTESLGDTFDAYELCLAKPGDGPLYEYAREALPGHCACPAVAGIIKAAEAECKLALPRDAEIRFEKAD